MNEAKSQFQAYLYAALSIVAWSTISTAFKLSLRVLTPLGLLLLSSVMATIFLGGVNLVSGQRLSRKQLLLNLRQSLPAGMLNPFAYYLILFEAYSRLRAQEAQALNYTWAIVLALFSVLLMGERFRWLDIFALVMSLAGVVVISTRGDFSTLRFDDLPASLLALFTSVVWALYWIISRRDKRSSALKLFFNFLCGALAIGGFAVVSGLPLFLPGASLLAGIAGGVYVGIFEMGLTFLLWDRALAHTTHTATISNLIFFTPFISLLFISGVLHEKIATATFVGLLMIVVSNLIQKSSPGSSQRKD